MLSGCGDKKQRHAFDCLKACMETPEVMKYFNSSLKTELIVDASPVGLRTILTQVTTDGGTNIKAYAAVHSIGFRKSLRSNRTKGSCSGLGNWTLPPVPLWVILPSHSDHKPLEVRKPYKTNVVYKPGANNPAYFTSRHLDPKQLQASHYPSTVDAYFNFVTKNAVLPAITLQEVKDTTTADETLQNLARVIATQK